MFVLLISGFTPRILKISPHKWEQLGREVVGDEFIRTLGTNATGGLWRPTFMERSWLGNYGICGWKIDGQKRVADVFAKKRLCKHLDIDLIQTFANSRIAKDEMEIDNLKFLPFRKFLGCWCPKCEFPTQNDCGCVLLNKLKNDLPQNL